MESFSGVPMSQECQDFLLAESYTDQHLPRDWKESGWYEMAKEDVPVAPAPDPLPPSVPTFTQEQEMKEFFEDPVKNDVPARHLCNVVYAVHEDPQEYPPIVYVVNSSGSGKTYACMLLCQEITSAYLTCQRARNFANAEVLALVKAIDAAPLLEDKNAISTCFIRAIENSLRNRSPEAACKLQFEKQKYLGIKKLLAETWPDMGDDFYGCLLKKAQTLSPESKARLKAVTKSTPSEPKNLSVMFAEVSVSADEQPAQPPTPKPLVVIFDEADGLLGQTYGVEDERCPLRCIQRALGRSHLIGIFLCTSSRLECIENLYPSGRSTRDMKPMIDPVIEMCSHDMFQDHLFFLGRPLWKKQFDHREGKDMNRLIQFARSKLLSGRRTNSSSTANALHCALFALRFGFEPVSSLCSEFVSDYMAVMVKLTRDSNEELVAVCKWLSEPILAEASSSITMNFGDGSNAFTMSAVATAVRNSIIGNNVIRPSTGDRGEVVVGALLGYTLDILKAEHIRALGPNAYDADHKDKNMSCGVITAYQFLCALGVDAPEDTKAYYVNFTHFMRVDETVTEDICYQAVDRCAALYVTAGAKALDLVMLAYKKNVSLSELTFLPMRVQVKNLVETLTVSKATVLGAGMSPQSQCQPVLPGGGLEIGIVVATGTGGTNQNAGVSTAIISPPKEDAPITRSRSTRSTTPYYGFLLSLTNVDHFKGLRSYKGPKGTGSDGMNVISAMTDIAQHHVQTDVDDCFTDWFERHAEGVLASRESGSFLKRL
eukprot:gene10044-11771_t